MIDDRPHRRMRVCLQKFIFILTLIPAYGRAGIIDYYKLILTRTLRIVVSRASMSPCQEPLLSSGNSRTHVSSLVSFGAAESEDLARFLNFYHSDSYTVATSHVVSQEEDNTCAACTSRAKHQHLLYHVVVYLCGGLTTVWMLSILQRLANDHCRNVCLRSLSFPTSMYRFLFARRSLIACGLFLPS